MREIVVDNFAGGGGASEGIERALGRPIDFAINHDAEAVAMHRVNHPHTHHFCESVWDVNPRTLARGEPMGLGWFSPDCTYHSKARGGKPFRDRNRARRVRGLAWLVHRWIDARRPRVIMLENVEEFADWGPLLKSGMPDPKRRGQTFRRWHRQLENAGYQVDMRMLRACDYGAPTTRRRLFVIARCDGEEIIFPEALHGPGAEPYRTAAECIDWSIPCPSIFSRDRPLADATLRRIARGVMRYVINSADPFIVPLTHQGDSRIHPLDEPMPTITGAHRGEHALITPFVSRIGQTGGGGKYVNDAREPLTTITTKAEHLLISPTIINTRNGERHGRHGEQAPRVRDIRDPLPTITAQGSQGAIVSAFLARHYGGGPAKENDGATLAQPVPTITCQDHHALVTSNIVVLRNHADGCDVREPLRTLAAGGTHFGEVRAFLMKYYSPNDRSDPRLTEPLHTIRTKDCFSLVTVRGTPYAIVDIGMRMLTPRELYRAQGFGDHYVIDPEVEGKTLTKTAQVHMVGNSVPPPVAEQLVRANVVTQQLEVAAA